MKTQEWNKEVTIQSLHTKPGPIPFVAVLTMAIVGVMLYSSFTGSSIAKRYAPLQDAAMEIKFEATTAHLWFEEAISGDRTVAVKDIWEHLDQAEWYALAMLKGGENQEGKFVPLRDTVLRREIERTLEGIDDFRVIAQERWKMQSQSGVGSEIEQRFDKTFEDFLASVDKVETALQLAMGKNLQRFRVLQGLLITTVLALGMIIGVLLRRHDRRRISDMMALQEKEEDLRTTLDSIGDAVISTDTDGCVTRMNPVAEKLTGWTLEEAKGKPLTEVFNIINTQTKEPAVNPVKYVLQTGEVVGLANHTSLIAKDGTEYQIADSAAPIRDTDAVVAGIILVFRDVTEEYALQREREKLVSTLKLKNRELQDIVYSASHDLRSPLVNIEGFSNILETDCNQLMVLFTEQADGQDRAEQIEPLLKEGIPESLGFITRSTKRMASLLDGLLQVSRVGSVEITNKTLDMDRIVAGVLAAMEHQINESNAAVTVDSLPGCIGDAHMMDHVLTNLVSNAVKYLDPGKKGKIRISGKVEDSMSIYCVQDNGIGISPAHQQKVFEIFHRLNPEGSVSGEGLGLTIVTRIMARLGGEIWLESEPGSGSKFFIALPKVL